MRCLNCGADGVRGFCPACGQRHVPLEAYDLRAVATDYALQEVSKMKLLRTLGGLFLRPGALTRAFMAGKRRSQVNPLWLYAFVLSLVLALQRWVYPAIQEPSTSMTRGGFAVVNVGLDDPETQAAFDALMPMSQELTSYGMPVVLCVSWILAARLLFTRSWLSAGVFSLHLCTVLLLLAQPFEFVEAAIESTRLVMTPLGVHLALTLFYTGLAFQELYGADHVRPVLRAFLGWLVAYLLYVLLSTILLIVIGGSLLAGLLASLYLKEAGW